MNKRGQIDGMLSNVIFLITFVIVVAVVGILAGLIYYDILIVENVLKTVDFPIPIENNVSVSTFNITTFQDIMGIVVYPILDLKDTLPVLTYFMVFGLIIALGISAYLSSKNPVFFVLHVLFLLLISYFCVIISNMYIDLMSNPFINQMMIPFTIYNKLMFFLPQIVFFTGLLFGGIAFINLIKPPTSSQTSGINYGGDY